MSKSRSTVSELTGQGRTLCELLERIAINSGLSPDTNWARDDILYFRAKRRYNPAAFGGPMVVLTVTLLYSRTADMWVVAWFNVGLYGDRKPVDAEPILDGSEVLKHRGKRFATAADLVDPGKDVWIIRSDSNLQALFESYIRISWFRGLKSFINIYPKDEEDKPK